MSKECIQNCPKIQEAIQNFPEGIHPDQSTTELLRACEASYDCPGPQLGEVEVVVGLLHRHTELQPGFICGLPE